MDFSIKAVEAISIVLAEEIGKFVDTDEIKDLESLENGIREIMKEVGLQVYEKVLEKEDRKLGIEIHCECGRMARRISRRIGKLMTVFGWISYRRSYYGCTHCGEKQSRLDKNWRIHPGEVSPVMSKLLAIAGVEVAFERSKRNLKAFLLVDVSDNTIRKHTQQMGRRQSDLESQWIKDSQDEGWLQSRERRIRNIPEQLYGSMDGVQIPVGEEWRELKVLTWYRVDPVYGQEKHRSQEISYHCEIAPAQEFGNLFWATGVKRLADKAKELIFVCDGAGWIWKLISHYFPDAVQIVDWYHACEYLSPIAAALFPKIRRN